MKKRILMFMCAICFIIPAMFCLSACSQTPPDIQFKVENGYVQYYDGSNWNNLIAIEEFEGEDGDDADIWTIGDDGYWYKNGSKTNKKAVGDIGAKGNGIKSIAPSTDPSKTNATQTTYIITLDDNSTYEFTVKNGQNGTNGDQYTIGTDGYWYKNGVKTDNKAIGEDGDEYTIGADGYWYLNGEKTDYKAVINQVHKIDYDYNFYNEYEIELIFNNYRETEDLEVTKWIENIPTPNEDNIDSFDGWFIEGTDKKIENYDFIGGDVTLVAKWNKNPTIPSGIHQDGKRLYTWSEFVDSYQIGSGYTALNGLQNYGIVIDDSVVSVGEDQFRGETGLSSVIIGQGVVNVGVSAFSGCSNLKSVIIGASVESIGVDAFKDTALEEIVVPGNVKSIGNGAFSGCTSLNNVKLENGVEQLNGLVFSNCENLKNITIPDSLTNLSYTDFNGCINLEKIVVGENNQNYCSVDGVLYNKQQSELIKCPATKTGYFDIPQSVEKIVTDAFSGSQLTHIYADSDNLKVIEYGAFNGCEKLLELRFEVNSSWVLEPEFSGETATMNVVEYGYTAIINGQTKDIAQQWLDIYSSYNWNKEVESN